MMKSLQVSGGQHQNKKKSTQVASAGRVSTSVPTAGNKQTVVTPKPSASKPNTQQGQTTAVIAKPPPKPASKPKEKEIICIDIDD